VLPKFSKIAKFGVEILGKENMTLGIGNYNIHTYPHPAHKSYLYSNKIIIKINYIKLLLIKINFTRNIANAWREDIPCAKTY
jgi:hypothetical protein